MTEHRVPSIVAQVFRCYTTRSASELRALHTSTYIPTASFEDPMVYAQPQKEAMLQFYSLQKLFSSIAVEVHAEPKVEEKQQAEGQAVVEKISVDCTMKYEWAKGGFISKRILPDVTPIHFIVELDVVDGKVVSHVDHWIEPAIPNLPRPIRSLSAMLTNGVFRLLGWETELMNSLTKQE